MKKILTMILSLALVLSMIPATASVAFAESGNGTVAIGETTYDVTVSKTEFTYDGTTKNPSVTLGSGAPSEYAVSYQRGGNSAELKDAGTYAINVSVSGQSYTVKDCTIIINKASPMNLTVKQITGTTLTSNSSGITSNAKNYFAVYDGNTKLEDDEVDITAAYENTTDSYKVTAKGKNKNYSFFTITNTFNVNTDISSDYTATVDNESITYTGAALAPKVTVQKNGSSQPLEQGIDYNVTVNPATVINANTECKIVVTGSGRYTGTIIMQNVKTKQRQITEVTVDSSSVTVVPGQQPNLVLTYNGKTLKRDTDYTYPTNVATATSGTVQVTVTGKGNFTGTKTVSVTVTSNAKDLTAATLKASDLTYNGAAQAPTLTLTVGATRVDSSYYTVKYKLNSDATYSATKPINAGSYDVEVTANTSNRGGFSGTKSFPNAFKINQRDIADNSITATYTGKTSDPVTVKYGTTTLKQYTDYTTDAYSASKTFYTVTGKGNFTGNRRVYTTTKSIANCTITFSNVKASEVYGKTYTPKVAVYDATARKNLYEKTDYEISYKNAKNQTVTFCKDTGNYSVIVTGKGEYTGSKTLTFTITGTDISKYTVTLRETTVTADGTAKTPVITKVAYGSSSLSSSDYTVSYQDSMGKTVTRLIEPGTYKVVVTGKNGYSGSCYATYTILGLTQSITGIKNYYKVYPTTQPFKLDPQAAEKTGFTFTSSDPTVASVDAYGYVTMHKPGRAKITITTKGTVKYNQATTSTEIRVYPNKVTMSRNPWTTGKKGQIKVRWNKRVGATRYEIRYSRQKSFKKGSYKTKKATAAVNSYSTQSTTVSGLRKGYTYYVKVRAVTQVYDDYGQKVNYYGNWSKAKTVKVK